MAEKEDKRKKLLERVARIKAEATEAADGKWDPDGDRNAHVKLRAE